MKTKKKLRNYIDILNDMTAVNLVVFISYIVCAVIYAVVGYVMYRMDADFVAQRWMPIMYFLLLLLPIVLACFDYSESKYRLEFRYSLYFPAFLFYGYLLFLDRGNLFFLFAVAMIGMAGIYCDIAFSALVSFAVSLMHVLVILYYGYDNKLPDRVYQAALVVVIIIFFNLSSNVIVAIRNAKLSDVNEEKQRFQALASVDEKWIFEYDIISDLLNVTKHVGSEEEELLRFENISKEAKFQRHVLYADWDELDHFLEECKSGKPTLEAQLRLRDYKADYLWYQFKARTLFDGANKPISVIGTMENIDDRKRMELRIADENMRDPLTKLYERTHAKKLMSEFLEGADGTEYAGLLLIDVDDFSKLIEAMGTTFADEILKSMATDFDEIFYTSDILGRVGGDEFVILMKNIKKIPDIEKKILEVQDVVHKTYTEANMKINGTVSIGASVFPIDGTEFDTLYRNAEKALVYVKEQGKNGYGLYDHGKEEEYAKLHIEEKHNRIKHQHELETTYERTESDSLIELAFKLIDESKDTDGAINLLLRQVTRQMGLDAICVRHRVGREYKLFYPYRCIMGDYKLDDDEIIFTKEEWENAVNRIKDSDGFISYNSVNEIEDVRRRERYTNLGIRSFARCSYFEKEEYIGSIDFVSYTEDREWSKEDKQTIHAVTNVISSYLLKMKAYEDASDTIERLTGYDSVTGFYKYEKFLELATKYLKSAKHGSYVMVYLDFSNFKYINEVYGYEVGDSILKAYADAAQSFVGRFIMGSRVFSDNLVCLLDADGWSLEEMVNFVESGSKAFTDNVQKKYLESNIVCIIGLCPFEVDGSEIPLKNIISNANLARKEAKKPEKRNCVVYDEAMGKALLKEVEYANDMENALHNREFVVYMQPKIDLKKQEIIGAEALVRWVKPDGSVILPKEFISVFEKNKSITLLDYFVYEEVCKYISERIKNNDRIVNISVNVSRIHLQSIDKMVSYINYLLEKYEIPPKYLEFELTETISTEKVEDTIELLAKLRGLGVKVSMDDFGSGYSSLNVLTKLPLDILKLDKDFLKDFEMDSDGKIIIPSIIDMAKKLNLNVVCEGVETKEQVDFLRDVNCDFVQGYYYSKPVPLDAFTEALEDEAFVIKQENNRTE